MRTLLSGDEGVSAGGTTLSVVLGCLIVVIVMAALLALCGRKDSAPVPQADPSAKLAEIPIHSSDDKRQEKKERHEQLIVNAPHQTTPEWPVPPTGLPQDHQHGGRPAPVAPQPTAAPPRQPPQPNPPARVRPLQHPHSMCLVATDAVLGRCTKRAVFADQSQ